MEYDFEHGTECLHLAQKYSETRAWLIDGLETLWKVGLIVSFLFVSFTFRTSISNGPFHGGFQLLTWTIWGKSDTTAGHLKQPLKSLISIW